MGDPKKPRKKYTSPKMPWRSDILASELQLLGTYGLRNKRELWKAKTILSKIRGQARLLLAMPENERKVKESILLKKLLRYGFVHEGSTLDDILNLTVEDILERRLQTIVWRKGLAKSPYQARQFIVHGHIVMNGRVVRRPGMFIMVNDENSIMVRADSPLKVVLESQKG
ncbi:MAG: 30S ribosomal protein S4 [Nitrososphaeria archaeon]|nr:30S ribosomal protein S4 [Nitrososphaeria archaeon]